MRLTRKASVQFEVIEMSAHVFCDVTDDMDLHSISDFYAMLQYSFTRVTMTSGDDVNFPE